MTRRQKLEEPSGSNWLFDEFYTQWWWWWWTGVWRFKPELNSSWRRPQRDRDPTLSKETLFMQQLWHMKSTVRRPCLFLLSRYDEEKSSSDADEPSIIMFMHDSSVLVTLTLKRSEPNGGAARCDVNTVFIKPQLKTLSRVNHRRDWRCESGDEVLHPPGPPLCSRCSSSR